MWRLSWRASASAVVAATFAVAACSADPELSSSETTRAIEEPLTLAKVEPLVKVNVKTAGEIDVETDYLPQVVCCENGAAPAEALKAQAVMARTYMAFRYYGEGVGTAAKPLTGTTADQAYFCNQKVSAGCRDAVSSTAGEITAYTNAKGERFANVSFFVDGPRPACIAQKSCACAKPSPTTSMSPADHPADCAACFTFSSQGAANPAYVTYNWSHTGTSVVGSTIGDPKNESNRGCASQNIQACLGYAGWNYVDMLRVFYGQDIELRKMDGTEVLPKTGPTGSSSSSGGTDGGPSSSSGGNVDPPPLEDEGCSIGRSPAGGARDHGWIAGLMGLALVIARRSRRRH